LISIFRLALGRQLIDASSERVDHGLVGEGQMKLRSFRRLAFGLAFAMLVGSGSALADGNKIVPPESTFCPAGSGRACWIFGCWCETPSLSYVPAANCDPHKLPDMAPWTFNIYLDTDSACPPQTAAAPPEPAPPPEAPKKKTHY
jgi:hypothetical protein